MNLKDLRSTENFSEKDYNELLQQAVAVISSSRLQIAKQLNTAAIATYWNIGRLLVERKIESKYGDGIIKRLSVDLKSKYPNMGLSPRNLWNMKLFYLRYYKDSRKVQQAVAVLPWGHNLLLLNHDLASAHVLFYSNEVVTKGWSREMLRHARSFHLGCCIPGL